MSGGKGKGPYFLNKLRLNFMFMGGKAATTAPAVLALALAAANAAAAPTFVSGSFKISNASQSFVAEGSTTNVTTPRVLIRIDGTVEGFVHGQSSASATPGVTVGLWHMDGVPSNTLQDTAGGSFHLTVTCPFTPCPSTTTAPTPALPGFGAGDLEEPGSAVFFNDVSTAPGDQFASVADNSSLEPPSITLEAWLLYEGFINTSRGAVGKGIFSTSEGTGYMIGLDTNSRWVARANGTTVTDPSTAVPLKYNHVAMTFGDGALKLYVNGRLASSTTAAGSIAGNAHPFTMAALGTSAANFFRGGIDEVRLSNQVLSQDALVAGFLSGTVKYSTSGASGPWNYVVDPSTVELDGANFSASVDTVTVGGLTLADCSPDNYVAFLIRDLNGALAASSPYQVPVATVRASTPVAVSTRTLSETSIGWHWDGPAGASVHPCAHRYDVLSTTTTDETILATVDAVRADSTTVTIPGLLPDRSYGVRVRSHNSLGTGGTSSTATAHTHADPPAGTTLVFTSSESLRLAWSGQRNPADTAYIVYYGTVTGSTQTVVVNLTTATLTGLATAQPYFAYVKARNRDGVLTAEDPAQPVTISTTTMGKFLGNGIGPPFEQAAAFSLSGQLEDRFFSIEGPAGSFYQDFKLDVRDAPPIAACGASSTAVRIEVVPVQQPTRPLTVTFGYTPAQLDAAFPGGWTAERLRLARFDADSGRCVPLVASIDTVNLRLTAKTNHLSTFQVQLAAAAPTSLASARAFPNPMFGSRPGIGSYFTFDGLPAGAEIRVYTLRGELLFEGRANGMGQARWEAVNTGGGKIGSGLYLAYLKNGSEHRILKLAVER